MTYTILKIQNLTKLFGNQRVLKNITISLEKGRIYGLIGLNGAGKTTLINIICGVDKCDSGSIKLFGKSESNLLSHERQRIGVVFSPPALYANLTVYENLEMTRISRGIPNKEIIAQLLKTVGLENHSNKKAQALSLGLKQRLGIANALFGSPALLVLDEPYIGLDPVSIIETRKALAKINRENNNTMLISSNILDELDQLATDYLIIHEGQIIEQISRRALSDKCRRHLSLKVDDLPAALTCLEKKLQTTNYQVQPDDSLFLYDFVDDLNTVFKCLDDNHIKILSVDTIEGKLESYFLQLVRGMSL
ncbi:ABC transporter ATP-binding protein [Enterococcus sp. DIV0756]|uniref:ABC transporter ATP-binding protein n=1 Tax=Enterococcus sp. DIV0756 TaxID=2774636 RepID=UPI003F27710B